LLTRIGIIGWKVVLSPRVPKLTSSVVAPAFASLLASIPSTSLPATYTRASDFDWALHPGGATILSGVERAMSITAEHMRASYDTYINHGNSSSATIISVMDRLRQKDMDDLALGGKVKDFVVGCAFGPGIASEMCVLKRNLRHVRRTFAGEVTPPLTESEPSEGNRSEDELEKEVDGVKKQTEELSAKLETVCPQVPEQNGETFEKRSLEEALNGVDLD
jgi:fungal type III polyketide synthase